MDARAFRTVEKLSRTFVTLSLPSLAEQLELPSEAAAEALLLRMVRGCLAAGLKVGPAPSHAHWCRVGGVGRPWRGA